MKKVLFILCAALSVLCFNACKSSQSSTTTNNANGGVSADDIAYVYFVSGGEYAGMQVEVKVDNYTNFTATPAKSKSAAQANGVAAGSRHIAVSYNGKNIYDETISIKTGAKKYIKLP